MKHRRRAAKPPTPIAGRPSTGAGAGTDAGRAGAYDRVMSPYEVMARDGALLADWAKTLRVGSIQVVDATATIGVDVNGQEAVFLELVLADPADETWPIEDVLELRRLVNERARVDLHAEAWHIGLQPVSDDAVEDEDTGDVVG